MAHIPEGATEFIIELERTGALDPANYYTWGRDSGSSLSISSDLYVNSVWTAQTGTFYYDMTLGFENDKLYLSDNRYAEMSDCEYIAKNSVLQDAESEFVIYGQKTQTSSIGDEFYLNAAIAGPTEDNLTDQTQFTGDNSYQDIFDVDTSTLQGYYLKTIDLDLRNTTSAVGDVWLKVETITPLSVDRVTLYETPYIDASTIGSGLPHTRVPFDFQNFVFPNEDVRISLEKSFGANLPIDLIEPVSTSFLSTVTTDQPLNAISRLPVIDFVYSNDVDVQRGRYTTDKPQGKSSLTEVIQNSNLYKGIVKKIGQSFKDNTMTFSSPEQHGGAINYQYKCDPYGTVESFSLSTTTNTSLLESLSQVFTAEESGYLCYTHLSDFTDTDTAVDMALTLTIVNDCGVSIVGSVIDHFHNNIS